MTLQRDGEHLRLRVNNFGPILDADIELRPMTVFVGPSNTGKSYMAVLIYALHRFFRDYAGDPQIMSQPSLFRARTGVLIHREHPALSREHIHEFLRWASQEFRETNELNDGTPPIANIPAQIATLLRPTLESIMEFDKVLGDEIIRCFGAENMGALLRYESGGPTAFSLQSRVESGDGLSGYRFAVHKSGAKIDVDIPGTMRFGKSFYSSQVVHPAILRGDASINELPYDVLQVYGEEILAHLYADVISDIVGPLTRRAHYLPADRAGVMHAHQVVVRALIASASRAALKADSPMPTLSGVLGDFLEQLIDLAGGMGGHTYFRFFNRENRSDDDRLARELERRILGGVVEIEQNQIDYPSFVYRPNDWKRDVPLMSASSMVSELAPVVFYLRHVVQPGELLIVEEPESHLHPSMQVEFTRILAEAVRAGIRVLITTHSEWVLEELANLVRLSDLPQERRGDIEGAHAALTENEIGAWFFEPSLDLNGSVVSEIPLDIDEGNFPSGFGLVTESLYNRWAEISNRIAENS